MPNIKKNETDSMSKLVCGVCLTQLFSFNLNFKKGYLGHGIAVSYDIIERSKAYV